MRERTYLVAEVQLVVERVELELDAVAVGGRAARARATRAASSR